MRPSRSNRLTTALAELSIAVMRDVEKYGTIVHTLVSNGVHATIAQIEYQFLENNNRKKNNVCEIQIT